MVRKSNRKIGWSLGLLLVAGIAKAMIDLPEELSTVPSQGSREIITESASLSEAQKDAIQTALAKMFGDQIASTSVYAEIVKALDAAMDRPEVKQSSERFVQGLKDLLKIIFKNMKLSGEQLAKVRDLLETLKALAMIQIEQLNSPVVKQQDVAVNNKIITLQERISAHLFPLSVGMQSVWSSEKMEEQQKHIVQLLIDLIKEVLAVLPVSSKVENDGNPPPLAEPKMPDRLEFLQED